MWELRLGDEIDDYCIKCRRLTNHSIASMVDAKAAKVRFAAPAIATRPIFATQQGRRLRRRKSWPFGERELFNAVLAPGTPSRRMIRLKRLQSPLPTRRQSPKPKRRGPRRKIGKP